MKTALRRRAIECTLVRKSNSNPGYFKYEVTIKEKDGSIDTHPAYGKDMQSALSRLLKREITTKFENKLNAGWVFAAWVILMGWPTLIMPGIMNSPWYILYSFGSIVMTMAFAAIWYNHVNKK